jgi:predicted porin
MNKKLIALAVGSAIGALGASAAFAQSSVTLSGAINYNYGQFDAGGAGFANATTNTAGVARIKYDGVVNQESNWQIAGEEKLAGGMTAFFQCQTSMDIVGGESANMCARNSFIGLKGNFGNINAGNYDTPAKRLTGNYDPFPISAAMGQGAHLWNATASNTINNDTVTSNGLTSFARRQANLITYAIPTMNGVDAAIAWSATNEASIQNTATTVQKARLWSAMVNYTNGPLGLGLGYENHSNYNPLNNAGYLGGDDTLVSLGAGYEVSPALRLSGIWNSMKYGNMNAANADMSVKTWALYANWNVSGPYTVRVGYGVQESTSGSLGAGVQANAVRVGTWTANGGAGSTGSQKFHIEGVQALSKRTEVGVSFAQHSNDRYASVTIGSGAKAPNFGETATHMGMLIRHKF